jgi:hypothetical protein
MPILRCAFLTATAMRALVSIGIMRESKRKPSGQARSILVARQRRWKLRAREGYRTNMESEVSQVPMCLLATTISNMIQASSGLRRCQETKVSTVTECVADLPARRTMSNVIDFLENWGQDAQLRHAASAELEQALLRAGIEPAGRAALLVADRCTLESLLGARSRVVCAIWAPEEEEGEDEELPTRPPGLQTACRM